MDTINNGLALALFAIIVFSTLLTTLYVYNLDLTVESTPAPASTPEKAKIRMDIEGSESARTSLGSGKVGIRIINEG